jgi:uncharacterized protein (TIGR02453 family)
MIPAHILKFLKELQNNNDRSWFEAHRNRYENAKADFLIFTQDVISGIAKFDTPIGELLAKNCTFRINRDVRFSKNKAPYKNNMSAYFNKLGKKGTGAGYYIHVQPGASFAAAGIWQPEPAELQGIRQEIDYNFDEWKKIFGNAGFKKHFAKGLDTTDSLVRPPKGYTDDNPAIEFLKLKSFVVRKSFTDKEIQEKNFAKEVAKTFLLLKPMIGFLNRSQD